MNRGLLFCLIFLTLFWPAAAAMALEPPQVAAKAAIVMDQESGQVLYAKNAYRPITPASCGKILTALTVLDLADLAEKHTVTAGAEAVDQSSIYLQAGQVWSVEDLLKGALIKSGNDACYALAEATAGSEPFFVYLLNLKAGLLGATTASLKNTNGLPADGHLISAYDLLLAARSAMCDPFFRDTVASKFAVIGNDRGGFTVKNTNKLLWQRDDIIGIKTGTTDLAGSCLVTALQTADGPLLLAGVFNAADRYGESLHLLDWVKENYRQKTLFAMGDTAALIPIEGQEELLALKATCQGRVFYCCDERELVFSYTLPSTAVPPIAQGQVLGQLLVRGAQGELLTCFALAADREIPAKRHFCFW